MNSDKLPRYYVSAPNNDVGWAHIGDRECVVYGEACNHDSVIMVCGQAQDGVNTAHRYAIELAAKLNGAAEAAPAPIAGPTQRQLYKAAALQGWAAGRNRATEDSDPAHVAKACAHYADAMIAEDEEHARK